jgi:hypothetical protein
VPAESYVMFSQRPYMMAETDDDPLTIPAAPKPLLRLDPSYSGGGGDEDSNGDDRRPICWVCVLTVVVLATVALEVFIHFVRDRGRW